MNQEPKVAIVTGASRGLGRAIAIALAGDGMSVVLAARDAHALASVADEARAAGAPDALTVAADLSQPDAPGQVVEAALARFGRLDVLVNNAGATKRGDFLELTDDDHLSGFALKYHATVRFCRAAWPHLEAARGVIVNISGVGAQTPEMEFTVGGPVNSAILNLTKALAARAIGTGMRINALCPGHIATERLDGRIHALAKQSGMSFDDAKEAIRIERGIQRFGEASEIGAMVSFLCSDKSLYVHGSTVIVDGGATPGL